MIPGLGVWEVVVGAGVVDDQQDGGQMVVDMGDFARAERGVEHLDIPDNHDFGRTLVGLGTAGPLAWEDLQAWPR